jgi:two-component system OmpR family response regulator
MRILVVEDEVRVAADIAAGLDSLGFLAETVHDGEAAWERGGTENYSTIVLDLGLPGMDGLTVLRRWRDEGVATPVLILTARGSWPERVLGIDSGADDYLAKPFQMEELLARVRALVRRNTGATGTSFSCGPVSLDMRTMRVSVEGRPVRLTPLEFRLISQLFHNQGKALSQLELADAIYGINNDHDANAVEALVARIRRKLGIACIETKRGFGYVIPVPGHDV